MNLIYNRFFMTNFNRRTKGKYYHATRKKYINQKKYSTNSCTNIYKYYISLGEFFISKCFFFKLIDKLLFLKTKYSIFYTKVNLLWSLANASASSNVCSASRYSRSFVWLCATRTLAFNCQTVSLTATASLNDLSP